MIRVVFMGTPEFAVPSLIKVHSQFSIVGVYTQPDRPVGRGLEFKASPVKTKALEFGLPVFQPEKLSLPGEYEKLAELKPDVIVVVAYGQILKKNVLDLPPLGCVNVHSSLLPKWRGAAPIQWAILAGDQKTGVTTMHLVEKLDAGDILQQAETLITPDDTAGTLHDRLAEMGAELIVPTLKGLHSHSISPKKQDEQGVTYASKLTKEMEWLDPIHNDAETLERKVRALNPWPGTSVLISNRLKIKKVRVRSDLQATPGQIYERSGMVLMSTKKGSLELLSMQWDGKKEVSPLSFLNGLKGQGQDLPLLIRSQNDISS